MSIIFFFDLIYENSVDLIKITKSLLNRCYFLILCYLDDLKPSELVRQ